MSNDDSATIDRDFPALGGSAAAEDGKGGYYLIDDCPHPESSTYCVAHINSNGTFDPKWSPPELKRDEEKSWWVLSSMMVFGSQLYLAGAFITVNGEPRTGLASVSAETGELTGFAPKINIWRDSFELAADSKHLYVAGQFTMETPATRYSMAAFNPDGSIADWNPNLDYGIWINAIAAAGGRVYFGGGFDTVKSESRKNLAAVDAETASLLPWNPGLSAEGGSLDAYVDTIVATEKQIYIGGIFNQIGGATRNGLGAVDLSGAPTTWDPALGDDPNDVEASSIAVFGDAVFVGGNFESIGGVPRWGLAKVAADTGQVSPWNPGMVNRPERIFPSSAGVFVAGGFLVLGGVPRNGAAAFDSAGNLKAWDAQLDGNNIAGDGVIVRAIDVVDEAVYLGGSFSIAQGESRECAAAFTASGSLTEWAPSTLIEGSGCDDVMTINEYKGSIYLGGGFSSIKGQERHGVAAVDPIRGEPTSWNPSVKGGSVSAITINLTDNSLLIGGSFKKVGKSRRKSLAEVNLSDGKPTDFRADVSGTVSAIDVNGGRLLIGGEFDKVAGTATANFAAIDLKKSQVVPTGVTVNGEVKVISTAGISGNSVILGGAFTKVNSQPRELVALLDVDADFRLAPWHPGIELADTWPQVEAVSQAGAELILGGSFIDTDNGAIYMTRIPSPV